MSAAEIVQTLVNAFSLGSIYALFALGIALIFGVMRLVNLAHGEILMGSGYALVVTGGWPWPVRIAAAALTGVVLAALMHQLAFRPLRHADTVTLLVGSLAVSYLLQNAALTQWGSTPQAAPNMPFWTASVTVGSVRVSVLSILAVVTTVALLTALHLMLQHTALGLRMRAAAEDFTMARMLGVRANAVVLAAFAIGGCLAAVGGILLIGQTGTVTPTVGLTAMLFGLIACVVGGLGSLQGAVLGGFLLGSAAIVLQTVLPLELRPFRDAFLFAAVFLLILFRPEGLIRTDALKERV